MRKVPFIDYDVEIKHLTGTRIYECSNCGYKINGDFDFIEDVVECKCSYWEKGYPKKWKGWKEKKNEIGNR